MTSVPQPTAGNKVYSMPRGKLLGGSSGINYLMYVRLERSSDPAFLEPNLYRMTADLGTGMFEVRKETTMVGSLWATKDGAGKG